MKRPSLPELKSWINQDLWHALRRFAPNDDAVRLLVNSILIDWLNDRRMKLAGSTISEATEAMADD